MKGLISTPEVTLISRARSKVVHLASIDEQANHPRLWQTKCGWSYGFSRYFRVPVIEDRFMKCKKCFPLDQGQLDPEVSDGSSGSAGSSEESSSSDSST